MERLNIFIFDDEIDYSKKIADNLSKIRPLGFNPVIVPIDELEQWKIGQERTRFRPDLFLIDYGLSGLMSGFE